MFTILYPSTPFSVKDIDLMYEDEQNQAILMGMKTMNIDLEQLFENKLKLSKTVDEGTIFIYRGWMLKESEYQTLETLLKNKGASLINTSEEYSKNHYISGWYPAIQDLTFKSIYTENYDNLDALLSSSGFQSYFIKDYVKSLTTSRGSIAHNIDEAKEIIHELIEKRGEIEKGLCIKEFIPLSPVEEERYFIFMGQIYSRNDVIPDIVKEVAARHKTPFFSVDVAQTFYGDDIIVEIGDGQVSDVKLWPIENLYQFLIQKEIKNKIKP